jgi:hypothetical protein
MTGVFYLLTISLPLATILLVFGMRSFASIQQARARLANDDAYRQLAEKAAASQAETASALAAMQPALEDVRARLTTIETILKDVG